MCVKKFLIRDLHYLEYRIIIAQVGTIKISKLKLKCFFRYSNDFKQDNNSFQFLWLNICNSLGILSMKDFLSWFSSNTEQHVVYQRCNIRQVIIVRQYLNKGNPLAQNKTNI